MVDPLSRVADAQKATSRDEGMNQRATRARTASSLSRVSCDPLDQNNDFTLDVEKSKVPAVAMSELGFDG